VLESRILCLGIVLAAAASGVARADGDEGHLGGDAVVMGGNVYLLDLVEAGVEEAPQIDESGQAAPGFERLLADLGRRLGTLDDPESTRLVATKLIEVGRRDQGFALALVEAIQNYQWALVTPPLADIDDGDGILDSDDIELVQLAARYNRAVRINLDLWQRLTPAHRAALVFHEMAYALITPRYQGGARVQSSQQARLVTGFLFSRDFSADDGSMLRQFLGDYYPSAPRAWSPTPGRLATALRFEMRHVPLQSVLEDGRGHLVRKGEAPVDPTAEADYLCERIRDWDVLNPGNDRVALDVNTVGIELVFDSYTSRNGVTMSYMRWNPAREERLARLVDDVPRTAACAAATEAAISELEATHSTDTVFDGARRARRAVRALSY
jgi:hypothetical protein